MSIDTSESCCLGKILTRIIMNAKENSSNVIDHRIASNNRCNMTRLYFGSNIRLRTIDKQHGKDLKACPYMYFITESTKKDYFLPSLKEIALSKNLIELLKYDTSLNGNLRGFDFLMLFKIKNWCSFYMNLLEKYSISISYDKEVVNEIIYAPDCIMKKNILIITDTLGKILPYDVNVYHEKKFKNGKLIEKMLWV